MTKPKIQEMSNEDLLKRKKTTEVATGLLAGMLMVLLILALFLCVKKGFSRGLPFLIIFFSLSPIIAVNLAHVSAVKKELRTRSQVL